VPTLVSEVAVVEGNSLERFPNETMLVIFGAHCACSIKDCSPNPSIRKRISIPFDGVKEIGAVSGKPSDWKIARETSLSEKLEDVESVNSGCALDTTRIYNMTHIGRCLPII
jgi:hypothetical protein